MRTFGPIPKTHAKSQVWIQVPVFPALGNREGAEAGRALELTWPGSLLKGGLPAYYRNRVEKEREDV